MIKQLIEDIAYDKITLSQALTRAKLIESKINNENLKLWINKELGGYEALDPAMPEYRTLFSKIELFIEYPFGQTQAMPLVVSDDFDSDFKFILDHHLVFESISSIENTVNEVINGEGYVFLPGELLIEIQKFYPEISRRNGVIRQAKRTISKIQFQNIIEQTKQRLLDILMELDNEFPDLENEYSMNKENTEKVQNIITNNIYGGNNPMNIAAGQNVEQSGNTITISSNDYEKLESLGVEKTQIEELKTIVSENATDKNTIRSKAMGWLGSVSASVAGRGLYENIPAITDFVNTLF